MSEALDRKVWEETWRQKGSSLVFPDGHVDLHVDEEPPQEIEPKLVLWCENRARLASAAPAMARLLLGLWRRGGHGVNELEDVLRKVGAIE